MRRIPTGLGLGLVLLLSGCGATTTVTAGAGAGAPSPEVSDSPSASDSPTPTATPTASAPTPTATASSSPTSASGSTSGSSGSASGSLPGWGTSSPNPVTINAKLVTAKPGEDNVHSVTWSSTELVGKRTVRVFYYAGIEPCTVLDHVNVSYSTGSITISLFAGSDPSAANMACAALARATAVDVTLSQDPTGKTFVDGSTGKAPSARATAVD